MKKPVSYTNIIKTGLLQCPFCGGYACSHEEPCKDGILWVVHCQDCSASVASSDKEKSIEMWNARVGYKEEKASAPEDDEPKFKILSKAPGNGKPRTYVTIFEGAGGWNSGIFRWQKCDDCYGFYEPQVTGFNNTSLGSGRREDAVSEARHWAENEGLPLWIPGHDKKAVKKETGNGKG